MLAFLDSDKETFKVHPRDGLPSDRALIIGIYRISHIIKLTNFNSPDLN
jgi:hypothetical protein